MQHILRLLTLLTAGMLVSCLDGREEIWLNANGSGRAEIAYTVPAAAARLQGGEAGIRQLIGEFLKNTPAISTSRHEVVTDRDRLKIRVEATFESAMELQEISQGKSLERLPSSAQYLAGHMALAFSGRTVDFSRTVTLGKALPGAIFLPASQFEGRVLTYIIHLPAAASETNATRVTNGGRTLEWNYPLASAIRGPLKLHFKTQIPIPSWAIASLIAVVTLLAYAVVRRQIRARKSSPARSPASSTTD